MVQCLNDHHRQNLSSSKLLRGIDDVVGKGERAHVNSGVATDKMPHWQVRGQVCCDVETNYGKVNGQSRNKSSALRLEGIGPSQLQADLIACHHRKL